MIGGGARSSQRHRPVWWGVGSGGGKQTLSAWEWRLEQQVERQRAAGGGDGNGGRRPTATWRQPGRRQDGETGRGDRRQAHGRQDGETGDDVWRQDGETGDR